MMNNEKGAPEFQTADNVSMPVFRSIAVSRSENDEVLSSLKFNTIGKESAADVFVGFEKLQVTQQEDIRSKLVCPERPFSLMRTHFELDPTKMNSAKDGKSKFLKIIEAIEKCLKDFREYDFSFFPDDDCMWKGKFLSGSSYCEMHVHIYTQSPNPVYIIEANRLEGDSKPFFAFYREFKSLMLNCPEERPSNTFFFEPLPSTKITPEKFLDGVNPIFVMSSEPFFESRLEAAKMLCDLAKHPDRGMLQLEECRKKCVGSLQKLVEDDFELVKQHAMCAFSEFVEVPGYPEEMLKSTALRVLLSYMHTESLPLYETIQARRECARVLSVLAKHNVAALRTSLDAGEVQLFCNSVSSLVDDKLKKIATPFCDRVSSAPLKSNK